MPIQIAVPFRKKLEFPGDVASVFKYISDVKTSVRRDFPGVEKFDEVGANTFRWEFEKIGYSGYELAITLDTKFSSKENETLEATPVGGSKTKLRAKWTFTPNGDNKTTVDYDAELDLELPIPGFLKGMAAPITQREITGLFERYASAVVRNFRS